MKAKTIILLLLSTIGTNAQEYFIGLSIDPKMVIVGPYENNSIGATFNGEASIGVETEHIRFVMRYEFHPAIDYTKWSWVGVDYKQADFPFKNFGTYAGLEISDIRRKHDNAHYSYPNNFRKIQHTISYGGNLELQYRIWRKIYAGAGINVFTAEQELRDENKKIRWDAMVSLYFKIY